ncbi:MAG: ATP-binding cassette domain-containing protein [Lachnospiraceae bacterium]|nr:ATP-binding cassette domain-containing protein [Ruminococcus sp.]MCM1275046.1 ATP-binding cassette domain-containing protein [Lachnospiraceae bacterium]
MIELKNVNKTYFTAGGSVEAVKDVTLDIGDGEIFGIIGFSGAGKSTLVRCINLLERPTSGQVLIDGADITKFSERDLRAARRKIGMIFQHFNLMPSRTVLDNVIFALRGNGISKSEMREKALKLLELVEIADKADMYPGNLSGGQKQRVAIARALANDPKILLCDEATSALDPQTTKQILALLKSLNQTLGITIVLITHEMAAVKEICGRTAVMERGRLIEEGDTFSVFADPKQTLTKDFIATTSNLKKIHALLEENPSAVPLGENDVVVKLTYTERSVSEPLISTLTQKFGVLLNIIFADVDIVGGAPIGGTVAVISGESGRITEAVKYLIEKNVAVEVIKRGAA